ncbi:esterase, PHB depolymerase family [Anaerohalosphaera lusitana]|uniref:Esterase, PHB depolymerase family n=1 Tax=Anaerohalosphaera lusitana TaxID=1936003 RepID=A0A1U9NJK9_9BACT|nr:prolyl oligopeptidase family serine peptidase [Anaerohalosphaera lusitana]AQT68109.1 esterase, PHB depolymerase family [Anaerohalosphaera lusitana]
MKERIFVSPIPRSLTLTFIFVCLCGFPQILKAEKPQRHLFTEALLLENAGMYGRRPVHTDAVVQEIITGSWQAPNDGQAFMLADGTEKNWRKVTADDQGWFSEKGRGGYLYATYTSDSEKVMLLHMMGNSMAYVNGVPRVGSRYQYRDANNPWEPNFDLTYLPVKLKKGVNEFLFKRTWRSGGRVKAELISPESQIMIIPNDTTLPDLLVGDPVDTVGATVIANCTGKALDSLYLRTSWAGDKQPASIKVPVIQPMSVRKVAFALKRPEFESAGKKQVEVSVVQQIGSWRYKTLHSRTIPIQVKQPHETHKRTFISDIDKSVQYFAVTPASPLDGKNENLAMVYSVHGASVEALNQAASYAPKSWCNIVSPTNRRPYGFDWEDWGRTDLLEVMEIAEQQFNPDPSRVYLTGHSMGGHGTWINGSTFPDKFAAVGPSAGWISFHSYRGAEKTKNASPIEKMLTRAENPSDTISLAENLEHKGIYIIHGSADDNVPASESYLMMDKLKTFHKDYMYYEEPGAGHWWDDPNTAGAECVDWPPMFDFFARHRLPRDEEIRQVDFVTANPGVSAWSHLAGIEAQQKHLEPSRISIRCNPPERAFIGTTENVARLSLKLDHLPAGEPVSVTLDGWKIENIDWPEKAQIWLANRGGQWQQIGPAPTAEKGPHRNGPFKTAFDHNMMFVYGTNGTAAENKWARTKARFDAEQWWYQGNGSVDIISDVEFNSAFDAPADDKLSSYADPDRGVILYGNANTNTAWKTLLADSPIQVKRRKVTIGKREITGDDLACLFLRPHADSDTACVGVVSGTGLLGQRLTERVTYLFAGCSYPDYTVIGPDMLTEGTKGVLAAGCFGNDWTVENGEFVITNRETGEQKSSELPAYIDIDPRPFVHPRHYIAGKVSEPITIDGKLDEPGWRKAPWTEPHVDIEGMMTDKKPYLRTQTKMIWDDECLYIGAKLHDPHIWGTITERNAVIFHDNDFEVFLDPDGDSHNYFEFEMNALNTVWNLLLDKPYKHGGNPVIREMPGQKTGVFVKGTLNDPSDEDEYWTVEIAFPFEGIEEYAGTACPPADGDQWRINFSRVQWQHEVVDGKYVRVPARDEKNPSVHESNWIWSPQGRINMHRPETWGYLQFSAQPPGSNIAFTPDPTAHARYLLHKVLYAQEGYKLRHGSYAADLKDLGLQNLTDESLAGPIELQSDGKAYTATAKVILPDDKTATVYIAHTGRTWTEY